MGVGAAGVSAAVVGCGGEESGSPERTSATSAPAASPNNSGDASGTLAKVSDVPVGGGVVLADQKVVLTQPTEGEIKAFSAVCTHRGCTLAEVADGTINCGCHGSRFSSQDGSVRNGPATRPLPTVAVTVEGDRIVPA
jgi:Rieske Fe-S protein